MTVVIPSNDPTIAAQHGKVSSKQKWQPKKRSKAALVGATVVYVESLAKAWNYGRDVTVKVVGDTSGVAVAASTTDEGNDIIFINIKLLMPETAADLLALVGIVIHELGHLHHTPKTDDRYTQELIAAGIFPTSNMVEDGKQEMKKITIRPGFTKYLKYAILKHILETMPPQNIHMLYPLIAGRAYLPESLRDTARNFAVKGYNADMVDEFDDLLVDFFAIDPIKDPMGAKDIVQKIHDLFPQPQRERGCQVGPHRGPTQKDPEDWNPLDKDKKKSKKSKKDEVSKDDSPKPGSDDDAEHDEDKDAGGGEAGDSEEDQRAGEGEDQSDGHGDEDDDWGDEGFGDDDEGEDQEDEDESEDEESEDEGDGGDDGGDPGTDSGEDGGDSGGNPGGDKAGKGKGDDTPQTPGTQTQMSPEEFLKKIKELNDKLEEQLSEEYEEDIELIKSEAFGDGAIRKPMSTEKTAQAELVTALKRLADTAKGGIDRRKPKGRLKMGRYIRNVDRPNVDKIVFDKFRPDVSQALNMEIVLAVDNSGSIQGVEEELAGTVWALVTALESVGGPSVTVVLWNSDFKVWKVPSEKWRNKYVPTITPTGGTAPHGMLKFAREIFKNTRKKQKLLFILTDGVWGGMEQARLVITEMNRSLDVDSFIIGFAGFVPTEEANYGVQGSSSGGLVTIADFIWNTVYDRLNSSIQSAR